ncbi:BPI fold-containing family B member 3-like [Heteronotia binoei]|uniref:BPI fold-containing family B member 3-like n=1 Tax=Heteronotia binoei TaxID=13085 RepID=UPI00292D9FD0|nr:BPI fold-containing family B member 3-like [Heteronotia binoei]
MTGSSSANLTKGAGKPFLTTDLASVIPKISEHFSVPQPLVVKIRDSKFPLVSMNSQDAMVKQTLFTDVCTPGQTVLHLQINTIFKAMFAASNGKLFISLSQNSLDIVQASSSTGSSNAQKLHDWVSDIYMNSYLPAMNGLLSRGITLPSILNDKWIKANTTLFQDGLVISL